MIDKHHVFLSYSRHDSAMMKSIRDDLRAEGLTVWTDENLEIGTPIWQAEIDQAIQTAHCLVVILSPDSCQSEWVIREIQTVHDYRIRVFPILVTGDERSAIPFALRATQRVDARRDYNGALYELAEGVAAHCGIETATKQRLKAQAAVEETRQQEKQVQRDRERQRHATKIQEQRNRKKTPRRLLILGGMLGLAIIFLTRTGEPRRITAAVSSLKGLSYSPDGALIAAVAGDELHFWDAASLQARGTLQAAEEITSLLFDQNTPTAVTTSEAGMVQVWDLERFTERYFISAPDVIDIAIDPDDSLLAVSLPEQVALYELTSGQLIRTVDSTLNYQGIEFSRDSESGDLLLVMAGINVTDTNFVGRILSWNVTQRGSHHFYYTFPNDSYTVLRVNPMNAQLYTLRRNGELGVLFDAHQEAFIAEIPAEEVLGFTSDGEYALFVQDDRVQVLATATGAGYASVNVRADEPIQIDPRYPRFAYVTREYREPYNVYIFDLASKTSSLVTQMERRPSAIAFSRTDSVLAIAFSPELSEHTIAFYPLPNPID